MIDFKEAFESDCTENYGYTEEEAKQLWIDVGERFAEKTLDAMWNDWSENFPVEYKNDKDENK